MEIPHTVAVVADPDARVARDHIVLNSQDGRPRFLSFIFLILYQNYVRDVLLRKDALFRALPGLGREGGPCPNFLDTFSRSALGKGA